MTDHFRRTLRHLGFASYDEYLASNIWREFRGRYAAAGRPSLCAVCGCGKVTLHHVTYERVGCERFDDVMPLCWTHHKAVHRWLDNARLPVEASQRAVASIRERLARSGAKRRAKGRQRPRRRPERS